MSEIKSYLNNAHCTDEKWNRIFPKELTAEQLEQVKERARQTMLLKDVGDIHEIKSNLPELPDN